MQRWREFAIADLQFAIGRTNDRSLVFQSQIANRQSQISLLPQAGLEPALAGF
jgi:hypothetical protein